VAAVINGVYPKLPPRGRCPVCGREKPLRKHTRHGWVLRAHNAGSTGRTCTGSAERVGPLAGGVEIFGAKIPGPEK
jgi:hypothetical protein